jgi:hypothetical protein
LVSNGAGILVKILSISKHKKTKKLGSKNNVSNRKYEKLYLDFLGRNWSIFPTPLSPQVGFIGHF